MKKELQKRTTKKFNKKKILKLLDEAIKFDLEMYYFYMKFVDENPDDHKAVNRLKRYEGGWLSLEELKARIEELENECV